MNSKPETVLVKYPRISNLVNQLLQLIRRGIARLADPSVWTKKRAWVLLALLLRFGYVFMNEHGLNPFKKSLVDDHVFLTGAATGIGRLLAIRFAKLGCKLTLSDVNIEGLKETLKLC